jgi:hypothetical protein
MTPPVLQSAPVAIDRGAGEIFALPMRAWAGEADAPHA